MKLRAIGSAALLAALPLGVVTAWGQGAPHAQATIIACPATVMLGATAEQTVQGWKNLLKHSASFKKAEVVDGVGLEGPTLACSYALGDSTTQEIARLGRPEPTGMLCTVNTVNAAQFDCFPRSGADLMPVPPPPRP